MRAGFGDDRVAPLAPSGIAMIAALPRRPGVPEGAATDSSLYRRHVVGFVSISTGKTNTRERRLR